MRVLEPPRTEATTPDTRTRPHRFPTEDYFRFREYVPGDDSRRIHWKLSMKTGALQVRLPETRETTRNDILLLIDSFIPRAREADAILGADELLDRVVQTALALTRTLVKRGERVRIVTAALSADFSHETIEIVDARSGQSARWQDVGARVSWQSRYDIKQLLEASEAAGDIVVVTARFTAAPPTPPEDVRMTWVFMDPSTAIPMEEHWIRTVLRRPLGPLAALVTIPHPVGSDDNGTVARLGHLWRVATRHAARSRLRKVALKRVGRTERELVHRGDSVYRISFQGGTIHLRGIAGPGGLG